MDIKLKLLYIVIDLFCPLMVGYLCRYQHRFGEPFFRSMIKFNIYFIYTLLAILSFWTVELSPELVWMPVFGVVIAVIPGIAAYAWSGGAYQDPLEKGSYLIASILSNIGTWGGLCAYILFGEAGFSYIQLALLSQNFILFLFCFPLAQYYHQQSLCGGHYTIPSLTVFLNRNQLPVLGLIVGIGLHYSGIPRPEFGNWLMDPLIHFAAWTALLPVGYSIEVTEMRQYYRRVLNLIPIKFVITPVLTYLLGTLFFSDPTVLYTLLILASTPTAINAVVTAKIHNLNVHIAMAAFVLTTAIYIAIVVPGLFLWILA